MSVSVLTVLLTDIECFSSFKLRFSRRRVHALLRDSRSWHLYRDKTIIGVPLQNSARTVAERMTRGDVDFPD